MLVSWIGVTDDCLDQVARRADGVSVSHLEGEASWIFVSPVFSIRLDPPRPKVLCEWPGRAAQPETLRCGGLAAGTMEPKGQPACHLILRNGCDGCVLGEWFCLVVYGSG